MSRIHVDDIYDKEGEGAPTFPAGAVITGVATATTFSGNATGLTGTPNISVGTISATTYEGVPEGTNVLKAMLFS